MAKYININGSIVGNRYVIAKSVPVNYFNGMISYTTTPTFTSDFDNKVISDLNNTLSSNFINQYSLSNNTGINAGLFEIVKIMLLYNMLIASGVTTGDVYRKIHEILQYTKTGVNRPTLNFIDLPKIVQSELDNMLSSSDISTILSSSTPSHNISATGNISLVKGDFIELNLPITVQNVTNVLSLRYNIYGNCEGVVSWKTCISGGGSNISSQSLITDNNGNIIITGCFHTNNISFVNTSPAISNVPFSNGQSFTVGIDDIFIVKYNSSGLYQWATRIGGTGTEARPSVTSDLNGNVYVVGEFNASTYIYDTLDSTSRYTLSNSGSSDIFIVKYNSFGRYQWATRIGGTGIDSQPSVTSDLNGNVCVVGEYTTPSLNIYDVNNINSATHTLSNSGSSDIFIFIVKYNSSGRYQWAMRISGTDIDTQPSVATDTDKNVYVTCIIKYTNNNNYNHVIKISDTLSDISCNVLNHASITYTANMLTVKYNQHGTVLWYTQIGSTDADSTIPTGVAVDIFNNLYTIGCGSNLITIKDNTNSAVTLDVGIGFNTYIIKYS